MKRLEHRDRIPPARKLARTAQPGGTRADDGDPQPVCFRALQGGIRIRIVMIGDKAFQPADGDGFALFAADTFPFALLFLRADSAAHRGKRAVLRDNVVRALEIAQGNSGDKIRNGYFDRAARNTGARFAVQAALCLVHCHLGSVAESDLVKVAGADYGILLGHRVFIHSHISHCAYLRSYCRYALQPRPALPCRTLRAL